MKVFAAFLLPAVLAAQTINPFPIPLRLDFGESPRFKIVGLGALASRPATCTQGNVYICVGAGCTGSQSIHYCTTTNTWTVQGGGTGTGDLLAANNLSDVLDITTARSNLGLAIGTNVQAFDADLTTYAGITPSANVQTFLGAADYAAMRTQLGLVIGTNVQAFDADLSAIAALACAQDEIIKRNGSSQWVCAADAGAVGGDSITVNTTAVTDPDFDDASPAAPGGGINIKFQTATNNISAYLPFGAGLTTSAGALVVDPDVFLSQFTGQQATPWVLAPTGANGTAYAACPTPDIGVGQPATNSFWILHPDVNSGDAPTLNICGEGALNLQWLTSGTLTNVTTDELDADAAYLVFKLASSYLVIPLERSAGSGTPGGSGTELQYRGGASTFSALANSSVPNAGEILLATTPNAASSRTVYGLGSAWTTGGSASGTYLGINAGASYAGDYIALGEADTRWFSLYRDATYNYLRIGAPGTGANASFLRHSRSGSGVEVLRGDSATMAPWEVGIFRTRATPQGFTAFHIDPGVSPGSAVWDVHTAATNDDPGFEYVNYRAATTDATVTTLATIAAANSTTTFIEFRVWARRTGGTAGTAEDGAAYRGSCVFQAAAGTATQIGATTILFEQENQNWTVGCSASAGNAIIQVTGAVNNNVTWHGEAWVRKVGS